MKRTMMFAVVVTFLSGCLFGCVVVIEKDSSAGIRFGTDIGFYTTAPDDGATARVNLLPEVWERIKKEEESKPDEGKGDGD